MRRWERRRCASFLLSALKCDSARGSLARMAKQISAAAAAAARADAHKTQRVEEVKAAAIKEGWAPELIEGWPGGDRVSLVRWLAKGNEVAIKFQSAIRAKRARNKVAPMLAEDRAKRAEERRLAEEAKVQRQKEHEERYLIAFKQAIDMEDRANEEVQQCLYTSFVRLCLALVGLITALLITFAFLASPIGRCYGAWPLPVTCLGADLPSDADVPALRNAPSSHWRQAIACCDYQRLSLPVPSGAEFLDVVGVLWTLNGQRSVSFQRLKHAGRVRVACGPADRPRHHPASYLLPRTSSPLL